MFNTSYPNQRYGGYSYLPEMQGMTDIQNRQFVNKMNAQVGNLNNAGARSNLQSSGAFLAQRANLGAKTALGEQDIADQNMYKNALFALQDRRERERRDFNREMADTNFQRQMQFYKMKMADEREAQLQSMVGGGIGNLVGMGVSRLFTPSMEDTLRMLKAFGG